MLGVECSLHRFKPHTETGGAESSELLSQLQLPFTVTPKSPFPFETQTEKKSKASIIFQLIPNRVYTSTSPKTETHSLAY